MSGDDSNPPKGFRLIPNFPRYAINEHGTVLSICGIGRNPKSVPWCAAKTVKLIPDRKGYLYFNAYQRPVKGRVYVHLAVITLFIGPRLGGLVCRHLDGNNKNNHASNLMWGTPKENQRDRKLHGTDGCGSKNPLAKLTEFDVLEIRKRRENGEVLRSIAEDFPVAEGSIWRIATRLGWKHI